MTSSEKSASDSERVFGITLTAAGVRAEVMSTGCTSSKDFEISHTATDAACELTLVRKKPDFCRRVPFMVEVSVPWSAPEGCENLPVKFTNEITTLPEKNAVPAKQLPGSKL
jgi:hypothetical protein